MIVNEANPINPTLALAFTLTFLWFTASVTQSAEQNETHILTQFRLQTDAHGYLLLNWTGGDACTAAWHGVNCSPNGRVVALSLPSLNLRGPIDSLSSLTYLRFLDLHNNRLNGTVEPICNCTSLELLYLSGNDFSGEIPREIGSLKLLVRLDISDNNINGSVPKELSHLSHLLTLRLQNNVLSGHVPDFCSSLVNLIQLNMTNNELHGHLADAMLQKFGSASFSGNNGLCGSAPLPECSSNSNTGDTDTPPSGNATNETVPANPSAVPQTRSFDASSKRKERKGLSPGGVVAIVVGICVAVLVLVSFTVAHCCARGGSSNSRVGSECGKRKSGSSNGSSEKKGYGGVDRDRDRDRDSEGTMTETEESKLVLLERGNEFELEDLLRASAEMLGKGSLGTVYRAVLEDGCTVAVKRLKDANPCPWPCDRKEFEQCMDLVGKLTHPNIVPLKAYYYAKEEKLLVYHYLPNGSLHALLHRNRGPARIPLDWTTRISIVLGAARGVAHIHAANIPHGNIKSSNVLLDRNGVACISDVGLSLLLNPVHAIARLGGHRAPEQAQVKRLSQQADVYSFGVLLLEVVTGRAPSQHPPPNRPRLGLELELEEQEAVDLPKWVGSTEWTAEVFDQELLRYKNIEEEMVAMLNVGLACVAAEPEKRPAMLQVAKMIQEIRVEQSPLREGEGEGSEDYDESRNSLSPSLPTPED